MLILGEKAKRVKKLDDNSISVGWWGRWLFLVMCSKFGEDN